mgnify:CR=1 FL=1
MTVHKMDSVETSFLVDGLACFIDLSKDLPLNLFFGKDYVFWFFERPLLCFDDIFCGLISESISSYGADVLIKFSGGNTLADSCFSVKGNDAGRDARWISKNFENFFDGKVGYPIILFNRTFDWIAFESAYEEFGVIAVKKSDFHSDFGDYLKSSFISIEGLAEMASGSSIDGLTAKALISSYHG